MNLSNLKPAWRRYRLLNSMQPADREEILLMLEKFEGVAINKTNRFVVTGIMFIILTFCCQGG